MPNIKFSYLYRDGANYKKYDWIVFANPENIELSELETLIKSKLIYGEWFYADEWKLAEIFTDIVDFRIDPTWHEFENIEFTNDTANTVLTLTEFMATVNAAKSI